MIKTSNSNNCTSLLNKAGVKLQAYVTLRILFNRWIQSNIQWNVYENVKVCPYSVHSNVNLFAWKPKDTNVTLMSFLRLFTEAINPDRKVLSQNYIANVDNCSQMLTKSMRSCQHPTLWRNHQNWNLSFHNFLLKYEHRIEDKELHDKEQKKYTNLFYFYVLKELSPKVF